MPRTDFTLIVNKNEVTPISRVKIILSLTDENAATFTITDPQGKGPLKTLKALSPPQPSPSPTKDSDSSDFPAPVGIQRNDHVVIERSGGDSLQDPRRKTCTITLRLNTDFNPDAGCVNTMPKDKDSELWLINVAGTEIRGICHVSYTPKKDTGCIGQQSDTAIDSVNAKDLATIDGKANQKCGPEERPGFDLVMVLDRSGSMDNPSKPGSATTRLEALRKAVKTFVDVWHDLLAKGNPDRLGVVLFDEQIQRLPATGNGLTPFDDTLKAAVSNDIKNITSGNNTSIGAGLIEGATTLMTGGGADQRRVILLISDGEQNTDPHIGATPPATSNLPPTYDVFTYSKDTPTVRTPLPGLSATTPYQIYTVTTGNDTAIGKAINENIAKATGGYHIHSEDSGDLFSLFALELLCNFAHFNSWQVAQIAQGQIQDASHPYVIRFPFSTTTQKVVANLSWEAGSFELGLKITSPAGGNPFSIQGANGALSLSFDPAGRLDPLKDWTVTVELSQTQTNPIDFYLVVLVEDLAVDSDLSIVSADYLPGDKIQLQARLDVFSEPVERLGSDPGDQVIVQVTRPGQSVGQLLSGASVDVIPLQETSPGLYAGVCEANEFGDYHFLFNVQGLTNGAGRCSRQAIKSVFVRAAPDSKTTVLTTSVQPSSSGNQLLMTVEPRTKTGQPLGKDWEGYLWFKTPGQPPLKAMLKAQNPGIYEASLAFQGAAPPPVFVYFLDMLIVVSSSVTPAQLPPLGYSAAWAPIAASNLETPTARLPYISTWLTLGPIFDPAHQLGSHVSDNYPRAGELIMDIDNHRGSLNPEAITATLEQAPRQGDTVNYGGRVHPWRVRSFTGLDWENISDISDNVHTHLDGDYQDDPRDPRNYLNFAGKHHALAFFLVYIIAPNELETPILLRHDDAIRLWLNGEEIKRGGVLPFAQDHDIIDQSEVPVSIQLRQGNNILLVAVAETHVEWGFSVRIAYYQGLRFTADNPAKGAVIPCNSRFNFVCIAGEANNWNTTDPNRTLSCVGGRLWKGRVKMLAEQFKFVADGDWEKSWSSNGEHYGSNFEPITPGIYDVVFDEDRAANPTFILVKPFRE